MRFSKPILVTVIVLAVLGLGLFAFFSLHKKAPVPPSVEVPKETFVHKVIGKSVEGRDIESYTYGNGGTHLLFVGGMHGGYEWNSVLLAYQFMDYLKANPSLVPSSLSIDVIPALNVDGVYKIIGKEGRFVLVDVPKTTKEVQAPGRFNAHGIDLNRNFDCNWQATSMWQNKTVSAGTAAFSEPEALALKNFVLENKPSAAVFWHSQANAVYASECNDGILPKDLDVMNAYAKAAGYPAIKTFDAYKVTGDSEGWLASIGIPAITVELKTHETLEWEQNLAGVKALIGLLK